MKRIARWWSGLQWPWNLLVSLGIGLAFGGLAWLWLAFLVPDRYWDLAWTMLLVALAGTSVWNAVATSLRIRRIRRKYAHLDPPED